MDCHSFRIIGNELSRLLTGARIEKIHSPFPNTLSFQLFTPPHKSFLFFYFSKQQPLFFLSDAVQFPNPATPSSHVMFLRKHTGDRRLGAGVCDFINRRLYVPINTPAANSHEQHWLLFDIRLGVSVTSSPPIISLPPRFWPAEDTIATLCSGEIDKLEKKILLQKYPTLSPSLRESLCLLDSKEKAALLRDLEYENDTLFLYAAHNDPSYYSAWPLPNTLYAQKGLAFLGNTQELPDLSSGSQFKNLTVISKINQQRFLRILESEAHIKQNREKGSSKKKHARLEQKLRAEIMILRKMVENQKKALLLQENLWQLPAEEKKAEVTILPANCAQDQCPITISLDQRYSIKENMERLFKAATKGKRGLIVVKKRLEDLSQSWDSASSDVTNQKNTQNPQPPSDIPTLSRNAAPSQDSDSVITQLPDPAQHVAAFKTTNGFVILRGKNAKGNHKLQKMAKSYDLWLHLQDGASAHAVIRLNFANQEVPEATLFQAGKLVMEKSQKKEDNKATILIAQLRHVHAIKYMPAGTVRVDKVLRTIVIEKNSKYIHKLPVDSPPFKR